MVRYAMERWDDTTGVIPSFRMHDFRRLKVWQLARTYAIEVDTLVRAFPRADRGVVANQLRRAVLSVPANIAEGCGKSSRRESIRFLEIASGSATEAEHHIGIALDLGYIPAAHRDPLIQRASSIQRMLRGLIANFPE